MSQFQERSEKTCLNCGAALQGRYCHVCGQENIQPRQPLSHLIGHFFNDLTHFDGKFFHSIRRLIGRPGFLPLEYIRGRRAAYPDPIRMYLFVSAVFFLIFYALFTPQTQPVSVDSILSGNDRSWADLKKSALEKVGSTKDSAALDSTITAFQKAWAAQQKKLNVPGDTSDPEDNKLVRQFNDWSTRSAYDSAQHTVPDSLRDPWLIRQLQYRKISIYNRYGTNVKSIFTALFNRFIHLFPYILFLTLPLNAFFLKLLYFRKRDLYLADHGIFLIYLYIFTFLFLLLFFAANKLNENLHSGVLSFMLFLYFLYGAYYTLRSMRVFYGQGKAKTLLKFTLLNILAGTTMIVLFVIFLGISIFQI